MALRDQPYIPLYVQDFLTDEKLMECSAEATGVYIKIMCIMHKSEPYGNILLKQKDKQKSSNIQNFALKLLRHLPYSLLVIEQSLRELIDEDVLQLNGDFLSQKRMIRDCELSIKRANAGQKGGKKTQKFASNFALAKSEANSESANENENTNVLKKIFKNVPLPKVLDTPDCIKALNDFFQYRDEALGKPLVAVIEIETFLHDLQKKCFGNTDTAIKILKNSIVNRYPGIYEISTPGKKEKTDPEKPKVSAKKRWGVEICPHCEKLDEFMVISESSKGTILGCNNCHKEFDPNKFKKEN
jgi:hypothetical protein